MGFINDNFMLTNETAKHLFNDYAKDLPIIDYHCHLDPRKIAEDYHFESIGELLLGEDHYKWRYLRSNGVDEKYITGDGDYYTKFEKWASVIPYGIGNPLFQWNQLELKRYFDVDEILSSHNVKEIWDKCNKLLQKEEYSARGLIRMSNVEIVCTTDDPADDLRYHKKIKESGFETKVLPTMRPEALFEIRKDTFLPYMKRIGLTKYEDVKNWLRDRIQYFNDMGCRLSDHSLEYLPHSIGNAEEVFNKVMNGKTVTKDEEEIYKTDLFELCATEYSKHGWTMQLHIGALRNNNKKMYETIGADRGFDSMNDLCVAEKLALLLDNLEYKNILPKTILYVLNPKDNYPVATMMANFQKGPEAGRLQFGSGWWFNDQKDGMREQMKTLAIHGAFSRFIGMLTDSRSFISYPRHEYFRRILCSLIGEWVENGEYPNDEKLLKEIIQGICYYNVKEYLGF